MTKIQLKPGQEVWFSSDLHIGHFNVLKYSNRPFSSVDEMNSKLIENINEKVGVDDYLFLLGDVAFINHHKAIEYLKQIKCKKRYLILGNHDKEMRKQEVKKQFLEVCDYKEIKVLDPSIPHGQQLIVMCHYPMLVWNSSHKGTDPDSNGGPGTGSWMLHGHSHGQMKYPKELENKRIMDVGVDPCNYYPISYTEIKEKFKNCTKTEHHGD